MAYWRSMILFICSALMLLVGASIAFQQRLSLLDKGDVLRSMEKNPFGVMNVGIELFWGWILIGLGLVFLIFARKVYKWEEDSEIKSLFIKEIKSFKDDSGT